MTIFFTNQSWESHMISTYVFPGVAPYVLPKFRSGLGRDVMTRTFYFTLLLSACVFVLILTAGVHP
jgi:hypothetical protein